MQHTDIATINQIGSYALVGAFLGMALVGQVMWLDVSAIGTMLKAADNTLLVNLFLAGAMLKGALLGGAIGTVRLRVRQQASARFDAGRAPGLPATTV